MKLWSGQEKLFALGLLNTGNYHPTPTVFIITHNKTHPPFAHRHIPTPHQNNSSPDFQNQRTSSHHNHYQNRNPPSENTRKLSDREFQDRKSKGLCYRCDEKWRIGHICKKKELSVLIVAEEEEDESEFVETLDEPVEVEPI